MLMPIVRVFGCAPKLGFFIFLNPTNVLYVTLFFLFTRLYPLCVIVTVLFGSALIAGYTGFQLISPLKVHYQHNPAEEGSISDDYINTLFFEDSKEYLDWYQTWLEPV